MSIHKKPLLVGNWKMNPSTLGEAEKRFKLIKKATEKYRNIEVVVCPPYPFVSPLSNILGKGKSNVQVGAQDCSVFEDGSQKTGETSAQMLASTGVKYIILGHSERRALGETGQTISLKVQEALKANMNVIVCVGEKDRDGDGGYLEVIKAQIKEVLMKVGRPDFHRISIAYEPIWAIGRKDNVAITAYDLHQMVVYIKKFLKEMWGDTISSMTKILYGGSVNELNAEDIMWNGEVDGLLVGRASWESESFRKIFDAINSEEKTSGTKELKKTLKKAKEQKKVALTSRAISRAVASKTEASSRIKAKVLKTKKKTSKKRR